MAAVAEDGGCEELAICWRNARLSPSIMTERLLYVLIVGIAKFDTILNEPAIIIIQMRVNTCLPKNVPRVIPHLETRITDTSFIQNNIKSGSPTISFGIVP